LGLILLLFAPGVLASSLGTVPHALLSRDLDFRRRLLPETISVGIAAVVALVAAFAKAEVYSLVIYQLLRVTLNTVIAWMVVRWRPTAKRPDRRTVKQILSYALPLTGAELILYARFNLDYAIGGVRLGTSALGVYTLAWNTADRPALLINSFFDKVGFATFARLRLQAENRARLVQMYLTATRLLMALTIPLFLGAALVREELVATVFGGKWQGMVEPLLPLFILQMLWVIFYPSSSMVLALGHSRVYAIVDALSLGLSLTAILVGTSNGITGLSWGMLVASGATSLTWGALACWYLRPGLGEVAEALKMPLLFTLTTLPATVLTHWLAGSLHLPAMVRFGAALLVAVLVFGAMARLCWPALKQDFHLLREKLPEEAEPALPDELDSAEEEAVVELKG
jgi:PST family polysaccharide transporter